MRYRTNPPHLVSFLALIGLMAAGLAHGAVIYPQIGLGGGYETVVTITNPAAQDWTGRLEFRQGAHVRFPVPLKANGQSFSEFTNWRVAAGRTLQLAITGDDTLRAGFLQIQRLSGPPDSEIATSVFYRWRDAAGVSRELIASYPAQPSRTAIFAVEKGPSQDTGIALVAPYMGYNETPSIEFTLVGRDGGVVQKVERPYTGHLALTVGELFDQLPPQFLGSVVVDASVELCFLVLRLEIFDGNIQLTGSVPISAFPPTSAIRVMPFRPIDAEYSNSLDAVIAVAGNPSSVHIYDAEANASEKISLAHAPLSLSIGPDGSQAVVGHQSSFSVVNLVEKKVEKVVQTAFNCYDLVLTGNGYVYVFPSGDQWVESYRVRLADGEATPLDHLTRYQARGRLHPGGKKIYRVTDSQAACINLETGEITYSGYDYWASDLWFSQDGLRIFLSSGHVLRASDLASENMQPNGRFDQTISCAYHVAESNAVLWLPSSFHWIAEPSRRDDIHVVRYSDLQPGKAIPLPAFPAPSNVRTRGQYLFGNADGSKLILIVRAEAGSGLLDDYGVMVLRANVVN